jgi:hypothetical protein
MNGLAFLEDRKAETAMYIVGQFRLQHNVIFEAKYSVPRSCGRTFRPFAEKRQQGCRTPQTTQAQN